MSITRTIGRSTAAALLALTVAACSTGPEQTASATGHIRSWADWSAVTPTVQSAQTASLPAAQVHSWADWTPVAGGN